MTNEETKLLDPDKLKNKLTELIQELPDDLKKVLDSLTAEKYLKILLKKSGGSGIARDENNNPQYESLVNDNNLIDLMVVLIK